MSYNMTKGLFSVVVALYGVEDYVDTFFQSLERQTFPFEDLDVVVVDDESPDGSYEIVKRWAEKYPGVIRHTTQVNGGPGAARNTGLDMVRNEWVTFADPDDALQADYFRNVANFLKRDTHNSAAMLTTRVMIWNENQRRVTDTHPLRRKYMFGERLVDLRKEPNNIQLGGASIFLRRSVLEAECLRFDERVKPTFEDGEFIGRYLGSLEDPIVGLIPSARYLYRKRGNGTSLVQSGWQVPERYDDILRYGYLGLLEGLKRRLGAVPVWAQNMVLYDLQWYFAEDRSMNSKTAWINREQKEIFLALLMRVVAHIDRETIDNFAVVPLDWTTREALLVRYKGHGLSVPRVFKWSGAGVSPAQILYTYSGAAPSERFRVNGAEVEPTRTKTVAYNYFGQNFFMARSVWLPTDGTIEVWLDGEFVPFESPKRPGWTRPLPAEGKCRLGPIRKPVQGQLPVLGAVGRRVLAPASSIAKKLDNRLGIESIVSGAARPAALRNVVSRVAKRKVQSTLSKRRHQADQKTVEWALSPANAAKFKDAWVIMDRVDQADDNGEHLYRHIAAKHPEVNAWFLLERTSSDWARLESEGFKLVEYGSRAAIALVLNATNLISSDATAEVQYPIGRGRYPMSDAKIIFLQHGVITQDLSRWVNPKPISLFVTSTRPEYESIAGDNSPYKFTDRETCLTGLPRFDALQQKALAMPVAKRNVLLVTPTWRQELKTKAGLATTSEERRTVLEASEYARNWFGLLRSPELKEYADRNNLEIVYLPHPSFADFGEIEFPDYVRVHRRADGSVQEIFARSRVALTDYSSVAFDLALIGSPLVYFHFDRGEIFNGKHNYRKGYFEFDRDGLGPVALSPDEVMHHLADLAERNFERHELYTLRTKQAFAYLDDGNSERVFQAIKALNQPESVSPAGSGN
ncbi:bifunctional glycosyltransferase/CDP-glycerol:glycerophosphate glycerophosphotransferase [Arthrobacter sunyaminii]|uniref:Bifunctional glycosyltransferase family 2 protein/CDP-glycerol:glycerophosphate glycerophosphotransferase n=1 Tax=Arthrobacter sunyaminii TaxID=2816859 RepID=A0A975PEG7_9MICC|nr:CDP-glycerol glycerophosphotransferase family protein [Arthrobacter sunyaminii]MBO0907701.1 CDP-glycerol glycerophosphotransferase family protein [Arthrobacter sunyaminii]QWQ35257.1 bifunctional glycosyltransferase family 2 protein/CDP-glycerol:glycerophosphate glycerophosphotransferase [Arthrobacter sunyaminii]